MSGNPASREASRLVPLFHKAHGCVAALHRVDDQIAALFDQRRKCLDDLRGVQGQINEEFDRVLELSKVVPADGLAREPETPVEEPSDRDGEDSFKNAIRLLDPATT